MCEGPDTCAEFLQWALPRMQLRWPGYLRVHKRACKRIGRRLRELRLPDHSAYRRHLLANESEWQLLDELCRIVVSRFYRDPEVFDDLRDCVLPRLADAARAAGRTIVDVWSAGCASGEEPWTVRVLWDRSIASAADGVRLRIVATDADRGLLERARLASYPASSLRQVPTAWRDQAFAARDGQRLLRERHRHDVEFVCQDVRTAMPDGPFDLILCRNLTFTYFDERVQRDVAAGLRARLRTGGEIVVGAHEQLPPP